jgi:SAM-dependent methyltransferase
MTRTTVIRGSVPEQLFDAHATSYEEDLAKALSPSGEGREFFARGRIAWLARCMAKTGDVARSVLDFGCGDGFATPLLATELGAVRAIGLDVSERSIAVATARHASDAIRFELLSAFAPDASLDLAYCNGVFHHIADAERPRAVQLVASALRAGGLFALWENNPWSPATHYVMSRCAFDADAHMLRPATTRALLRANGFDVVRTDYRFIFPRALRFLRRLEDWLYRTPFGTQYLVLARKR